MKSTLNSLALAGSLLAAAPFVSAQEYTGVNDAMPVAVSLAGDTKYDGWYNFSSQTAKERVVHGQTVTLPGTPAGYPTAMGSSPAYPSPIASQLQSNSASKATFNKVANGNGTGGLNKFNADGTRNATTWGGSGFGPIPSGDSIYGISFSNAFNAKGGTFGAFEANPLANLQTVVFQVEIGSANGYDFYEPLVASNPETPLGGAASRPIGLLSGFETWAPAINLTFGDTTSISIVADYAALLNQGFNGTIPMPTGPGGELVDEAILVNLYGFQWDLSGYSDIQSFSITWHVVEHTQSYAVQLDQGGLFGGEVLSGLAAVPEPASFAALAGLGVLGLAASRRRRA